MVVISHGVIMSAGHIMSALVSSQGVRDNRLITPCSVAGHPHPSRIDQRVCGVTSCPVVQSRRFGIYGNPTPAPLFKLPKESFGKCGILFFNIRSLTFTVHSLALPKKMQDLLTLIS